MMPLRRTGQTVMKLLCKLTVKAVATLNAQWLMRPWLVARPSQQTCCTNRHSHCAEWTLSSWLSIFFNANTPGTHRLQNRDSLMMASSAVHCVTQHKPSGPVSQWTHSPISGWSWNSLPELSIPPPELDVIPQKFSEIKKKLIQIT